MITLVAGAGSITDLSTHSCLQVKALLHFLPVCSDILQICFIFEKNRIKNILKQVKLLFTCLKKNDFIFKIFFVFFLFYFFCSAFFLLWALGLWPCSFWPCSFWFCLFPGTNPGTNTEAGRRKYPPPACRGGQSSQRNAGVGYGVHREYIKVQKVEGDVRTAVASSSDL